jgi:hypothetical protein
MDILPRATPDEIKWGAAAICGVMKKDAPFFIGRNGTIETDTLFHWFVSKDQPYPQQTLETISKNAGVWPATKESIDAWAEEYSRALGALDGLAAGWYEPNRTKEAALLEAFAPRAFTTPLRSLEPYYSEPANRWTQYIANKHVAVVTSFGESVANQVNQAKKIWMNVDSPETVLPSSAHWTPIQTYFAPAIAASGFGGWPSEHVKCWQDAVDWTVKRVEESGATVAIIGCGGLGMIIAARLKALGISAFVLGGATQVLFGIKGRRWQFHPIISKFWNVFWVWPLASEVPEGARKIEGGCYWGLN